MISNLQRLDSINIPLNLFIQNNYPLLIINNNKDFLLHKEYYELKIIQFFSPQTIQNNIQNFENKILIPFYQKINKKFNKHYYQNKFYIIKKYKSFILKSFSKNFINKIVFIGSIENNFFIPDSSEIDICIIQNNNNNNNKENLLIKLKSFFLI